MASRLNGPPKSILLATDLSPRCDRALDRAIVLSQSWRSDLVILHVGERQQETDFVPITPSWRRPPDLASMVRRQLLAGIGPVVNMADIVVDEGDPIEAIMGAAEAHRCDLIITGISNNDFIGRLILGTTVDRLLRRARVPILVARTRAYRPYIHVAVAIDFSEPSRQALEVAVAYFPGYTLSVFHAYDPLVSGLMPNVDAYRQEYQQVVEQDYAAFLESTESGETIRQRAHSFIRFGTPTDVLHQGVRDMNIDLVVVGTQGRGALSEAFVGSIAKHLMAELPCDVLMIRAPAVATGTGA